MFYTPILPPGRVTARFRPETPATVAERRRERLGRLMARLDRPDIEQIVDGLIARLDTMDGDPDVEPNGDEQDTAVVDFQRRDPAYHAEMVAAGLALEDAEANGDEADHIGAEDDFLAHAGDGPGCPIADPDVGGEEGGPTGGGDPSWTEWHTRGRHKIDAHGSEIVGRDHHGQMLHEDDEDDDPKEDDDNDRCAAGDDEIVSGPVVQPYGWHLWANQRIGDDEDAEDGHDEEQVNEDGVLEPNL